MAQTVSLCGRQLTNVRHVCAFFDSREEQYEILNPYFRDGLDKGEEVLTIVDSHYRDEHVSRMQRGGVPDAALSNGQLKVLSSQQTYVDGGAFVSERMYDLLLRALVGVSSSPFSRLRTCGDMEWALENLPGTDDLIAYEARVNILTQDHDCTLLCVYDANRFSGRVVADVLATHSHVILGGRLYENQYYSEPREFLRKIALRRRDASPHRKALGG